MLALLCVSPPPVSGQGALRLDVGATHTIPPSGVSGSAASYITLGASLDASVSRAVGLFGSVLGGIGPSEDRGSWISVSGGGRWFDWVSRSVLLGVTASGRASFVGQPETSRSALVEAVPEMQVLLGRYGIRLFGTGGFGESAFTVSRPFIRDTRLGPRTVWVDIEFARDLWAYGGGAEFYAPVGPISPFVGGSLQRSPRGGFESVYGGLSVSVGPAVIGTELRWWDTPFGTELEFTAGVQIGSSNRISGAILGGHYGPDPLLDAPPATMAAATVSVDVAAIGREPVPLVSLPADGGPVLLRLPVDAQHVTVLGDFSEWEELDLQEDDGYWSIELLLEPGVYRYGFFIDGAWFVPDEAAAGTDEWGRAEAVLVVPEA